MTIAIGFWVFFASAVGLIGWRGDTPARIFASFLVAMTCASFILNLALGMEAAWPWIFAIDVLILVAALILALTTSVYWPLWFAAFQCNAVGAGIAHLMDGGDLLRLFAHSASFWAIPALIVAVIGVLRDAQRLAGQD
jgi:hypothetical protein